MPVGTFVCPVIVEPMPGKPKLNRRRPLLMCDPAIPCAANAEELDNGTALVVVEARQEVLDTIAAMRDVKRVDSVSDSADVPQEKRAQMETFEADARTRLGARAR